MSDPIETSDELGNTIEVDEPEGLPKGEAGDGLAAPLGDAADGLAGSEAEAADGLAAPAAPAADSQGQRVEEARAAAKAAKKRKSEAAGTDPPPIELPELEPAGKQPKKSKKKRNAEAEPALADDLPLPSQPPAQPPKTGRQRQSPSVGITPSQRRAASTVYPEQRQPLGSAASSESLHPLGMHDSGYRIRGGGLTQGKHPVAYVVVGLIVAAALALGINAAWRLVTMLATERAQESTVTITVSQSHEAFSGLPRLMDYVWGNADDAFNRMTEQGMGLHLNDRMTSRNPDSSAGGKEIVYLPADSTMDDLSAYNASEFNGFDYDDIQGRLLGSWMLDISGGDRGNYLQLKYVNLATEGRQKEMDWLLEAQGFSGDGTVIVNEGKDNYGNDYILGYTIFEGDVIIYWQVISCSYEEYYRGQDSRSLPDESSYVKLVVATWDFYGIDQNTAG